MRRHLVIVTLLLVMGGTRMGGAQEMNANTFQVGSRATLMGGAVVGGVRDTAATFYNPGALGFVENASISVSANAFRFGKVTIDDALGPGQDATADLLDPIPLLVSGMLRFHAVPEWAFGYALVTRQQYSGTFTNAVDTQRDSITIGGVTQPLLAQVVAQSNLTSRANELWAMGAAAWRPHPALALGVAPIVALRRQSRVQRFALQTVPLGGGVNEPIGVNEVTDVDFYQFSFLTRLGVAWEPSTVLKVGATLTTPNIKITGSGSSLAQVTANNIPVVTTGGLPDFQSRFGSDFQEGLSTNYRLPLSAAVGAEVKPWAPLTVGLTVDYSLALGREALLHVQGGRPFFRGPGIDPSPDSTAFLTPVDERHAVVNVSFGAEYTLTDTYAAYVGFWTDFSPLRHQQLSETLRSGQGINLATADIDLYHVVVGATRTTPRSTIAAGVVVSHGTGTTPSDIDITVTGDVLGVTQGDRVFARHVSFFSLSLLLGYTYFF